jgi:DNA helicase II / ATP-dependent DNA helicase PcrA
LTLGVLYRAEELADREAVNPVPFSYQVPLRQVLSQVLQCGENSQKVGRRYMALIELLGPEFTILRDLPCQTIAAEDEKLAAAVLAMRENRVRRLPGYDGVYGKITLET